MAKKKITGRGGPGRGQGLKQKYVGETAILYKTVPKDLLAELDALVEKKCAPYLNPKNQFG